MLRLLISALRWIGLIRTSDSDAQRMAAQQEAGTFVGHSTSKQRHFDADYRAATELLRDRMDKHYPDNYHARLSSVTNTAYDYGEQRAAAVDTASTAIAMALREGASVREAAEAGAASIGI